MIFVARSFLCRRAICGSAGAYALLASSIACLGQAQPTVILPINDSWAAHAAPVMGPNLSVTYSAQHDSSVGWSNALSPVLTYRFTRSFFLDATLPVFLSANAYVPTTNGGVPATKEVRGTDLLGDAQIGGHFEISGEDLRYQGSATVGLPTGNYTYGLTANTTTYNVTNHFEYDFDLFTPVLELGVGNNSMLADPTVRKGYTAVGPIANLRLGVAGDLPWNFAFSVEGYEDLPIGKQTIYGTVTRKGRNGRNGTTTVTLDGTGNAEDNGVWTELDYSLGKHFVLSGIYEHSIIQALNTTTFGATWTLRAPHGTGR